MVETPAAPTDRTLLGHPFGLYVCFMTELWERFAYYGVLSLLILYLTKHLAVNDAEGNKIVAAYGALVWMTPVLGGIVADRWLGSRKAVALGAILMAFGFLSISFPQLLVFAPQAPKAHRWIPCSSPWRSSSSV